MTEVYSRNKLDALVKKQRQTLILAVALPILALITAVILCLAVNIRTLWVFKTVGSIFSVICLWISAYLWWNRLPKLREDIVRLGRMLGGERSRGSYTVLRIENPKTVIENLLAYEIYTEKEELAFYYEAGCGDVPFSQGDMIDILTVDNYIVAFEVKK